MRHLGLGGVWSKECSEVEDEASSLFPKNTRRQWQQWSSTSSPPSWCVHGWGARGTVAVWEDSTQGISVIVSRYGAKHLPLKIKGKGYSQKKRDLAKKKEKKIKNKEILVIPDLILRLYGVYILYIEYSILIFLSSESPYFVYKVMYSV